MMSDFDKMIRLFSFSALMLVAVGCGSSLEDLREQYRPGSPREAYVLGLETMGIAESAVASEWALQGDEALRVTLSPTLPYREEGSLLPTEIMALGYRLRLERGQQLIVRASLDNGNDFFVDLYESVDAMGLPMRRVASADSTAELKHDIDRTKEYFLRLQPEILSEGGFRIEIKTDASIIFPVSGRDTGAVQSFFGDDREAGKRSHHGIDIFAPRGTPVIAVRAGRISRVRTGGRGGRTVWLRDNKGHSFYYAHLERQLVRSGQRVVPGDTLGLVGNSGNARNTPPHLHFGIYKNGPHNPWPFVFSPNLRPSLLQVESRYFGTWRQTASSRVSLLQAPSSRSLTLARFDSPIDMHIIGGTSTYYHVRLPDDSEGYVTARDMERTVTRDINSPIQQSRSTIGS